MQNSIDSTFISFLTGCFLFPKEFMFGEYYRIQSQEIQETFIGEQVLQFIHFHDIIYFIVIVLNCRVD